VSFADVRHLQGRGRLLIQGDCCAPCSGP
jgi:hypothetical protein